MTLLIFATLMYFLPSIIAHRKRDFAGIFMVNLLFGWTVVGWVIALVWACVADVRQPVFAMAGPARYCTRCGAMMAGPHFCPGFARPL
jgi:Superinfection immunity protein